MTPFHLAQTCLNTIQTHLHLPEAAVLVGNQTALLAVAHSRGFVQQQLEQDWWLEYCHATDNLPWLHWLPVLGRSLWVYPVCFRGLLVGVVLLCTDHCNFSLEHHRQLLLLCSCQFAAQMQFGTKECV
jgi:hypothetical protein